MEKSNEEPIFEFGNFPIAESAEYLKFVEYLETKDSPKAKKLLEKLKTLKSTNEYKHLVNYLLFDIYIEHFESL